MMNYIALAILLLIGAALFPFVMFAMGFGKVFNLFSIALLLAAVLCIARLWRMASPQRKLLDRNTVAYPRAYRA